MEIITKTARETKSLGRKIASSLRGGEILALSGDLGSGKTTFSQGLAEGLGVATRLISPTFILMRGYDLSPNTIKIGHLYHVDLYRLDDDILNEVRRLGITDLWQRPENIFAIEWAEKIKSLLPEKTKWVKFSSLEGDKKKIIL